MEAIMKVEYTCGYLIESNGMKLHVCYHNSKTKNLQKLIKKARNTVYSYAGGIFEKKNYKSVKYSRTIL